MQTDNPDFQALDAQYDEPLQAQLYEFALALRRATAARFALVVIGQESGGVRGTMSSISLMNEDVDNDEVVMGVGHLLGAVMRQATGDRATVRVVDMATGAVIGDFEDGHLGTRNATQHPELPLNGGDV